jgi:ADP-heptose:LPS heptosyltransferase
MLSWKRRVFELGIGLAGRGWASKPLRPPRPSEPPRSIFLIQPSHIGDVLVDTPLFHVLRRRFPETSIVLGCGSWNLQTLKHNPDLSEIVPLDLPWNNVFIPQSLSASVRFLWNAPQIETLKRRKFDVGIDLIGTQLNSVLLLRLDIPYRIGIRGAGGGYTAMQRWARYSDQERMARTALRLAEILGADLSPMPSLHPRLFLTEDERRVAEQIWSAGAQLVQRTRPRRVILGPAASFEHKCWPLDHYESLIRRLLANGDTDVVLVGGKDTEAACNRLAAISPAVRNLAVKTPLRHVFALVESSDLVICNSNMLLHVAAAFARPCVVVLSQAFESASQHKRQWAYDMTTVLGRDPPHSSIYDADEVYAIAQKLLTQ